MLRSINTTLNIYDWYLLLLKIHRGEGLLTRPPIWFSRWINRDCALHRRADSCPRARSSPHWGPLPSPQARGLPAGAHTCVLHEDPVSPGHQTRSCQPDLLHASVESNLILYQPMNWACKTFFPPKSTCDALLQGDQPETDPQTQMRRRNGRRADKGEHSWEKAINSWVHSAQRCFHKSLPAPTLL